MDKDKKDYVYNVVFIILNLLFGMVSLILGFCHSWVMWIFFALIWANLIVYWIIFGIECWKISKQKAKQNKDKNISKSEELK